MAYGTQGTRAIYEIEFLYPGEMLGIKTYTVLLEYTFQWNAVLTGKL